jgi:hypothetical protein
VREAFYAAADRSRSDVVAPFWGAHCLPAVCGPPGVLVGKPGRRFASVAAAARRNQLESKLVRETRERNCGYLSILWNRRVMLLTDMPAVRFGDDPRTLI